MRLMTVGQLTLFPIVAMPSCFRNVMNDPWVMPSRSCASPILINSTDRGKPREEDFGGDWSLHFNVDFVVFISC